MRRSPPFGTVDYYKAVVQHAGGFTASQAFTRLYMVPGQYHCLSGGSPAGDSRQMMSGLLLSAYRVTCRCAYDVTRCRVSGQESSFWP